MTFSVPSTTPVVFYHRLEQTNKQPSPFPYLLCHRSKAYRRRSDGNCYPVATASGDPSMPKHFRHSSPSPVWPTPQPARSYTWWMPRHPPLVHFRSALPSPARFARLHTNGLHPQQHGMDISFLCVSTLWGRNCLKEEAEAKKKSGLKNWFTGLKAEFSKIIWPDRQSLTKETVAVLAVSVLLGVIIAVVDLIVRFGIEFIVK